MIICMAFIEQTGTSRIHNEKFTLSFIIYNKLITKIDKFEHWVLKIILELNKKKCEEYR